MSLRRMLGTYTAFILVRKKEVETRKRKKEEISFLILCE